MLVAGGVAFKVHRAILARHSHVFKDMISFPRPKQGEEESFDGCPMVPLSDSAEDVAIMLDIFYNGLPYVPLLYRQWLGS